MLRALPRSWPRLRMGVPYSLKFQQAKFLGGGVVVSDYHGLLVARTVPPWTPPVAGGRSFVRPGCVFGSFRLEYGFWHVK